MLLLPLVLPLAKVSMVAMTGAILTTSELCKGPWSTRSSRAAAGSQLASRGGLLA